jgi:GNAT superfamily N-acetyltransferase
VFRPSVGVWAQDLLSGSHPTVRVQDFALIEDPASGEILSTLCLIRQRWRFCGVPLDVGQLELVATDERHRGRGLVRALMAWVEEEQRRHGCVLSCVQGVPEVYQRLGYHFAIPLKGGLRVPTGRLPESARVPGRGWRPRGRADLPGVASLFESGVSRLDVHDERDLALWTYQEAQSEGSEHAYRTFGHETAGALDGYVRARRQPTRGALVVNEIVTGDAAALQGALALLRSLAEADGLETVWLQLPAGEAALAAAEALGAEAPPPFAWQVRVPDWPRFLQAIASVLEARLAHSGLSSHEGELRLVREAGAPPLSLGFRGGRLVAVTEGGSPSTWDLSAPEECLVQLAMGYRTRADLESSSPAVRSRPESRALLDVLFPPLRAWVHETY